MAILDTPPRLRRKEAATYLGVKYDTLYRWDKDGKIPAVKLGRTVVYNVADLDRFIERNTVNKSALD